MSTPLQPKTKQKLQKMIREAIALNGRTCDLNHIDVSHVKNMGDLFMSMEFNGNISKWNVSNVTNMSHMFYGSSFNGDIANWNVSKVTNMEGMFQNSQFNGDLSRWNVSKVKYFNSMFQNTPFRGDISNWDTSNVEDMAMMFVHTPFNGDISAWNTSKVTNMKFMFVHCPFNGDISRWDLSGVESTGFAEHACAFALIQTVPYYRCIHHQFHDSPLGYVGMFQGHYDIPKDHPRAAQMIHIRSLCEGLNMDPWSAARYMYDALHRPEASVYLASGFTLE